jgi:chromosome segregation ATPase
MGNVQFILDRRKKAQAAIPSAPSSAAVAVDLPGLKRRTARQTTDVTMWKREYNHAVKELRSLNKRINSLRDERRKEMRQRINAMKAHMSTILSRIGKYSPEETVNGFTEDGHDF